MAAKMAVLRRMRRCFFINRVELSSCSRLNYPNYPGPVRGFFVIVLLFHRLASRFSVRFSVRVAFGSFSVLLWKGVPHNRTKMVSFYLPQQVCPGTRRLQIGRAHV